ncbi:MAG: hypothetical protein V1872_01105 [bacterium]
MINKKLVKKILFQGSLIIIYFVLVLPNSEGAIYKSAHDMDHMIAEVYQTSLPPKSGPCSYCHVPHKATSQARLWPDNLPTAPANGDIWGQSYTTAFCAYCHLPASPYETQSYGKIVLPRPFRNDSHRRDKGILTTGPWGNPDIDLAALDNVPMEVGHSSGIAGDGNLKCTSCHNVHDNSFRPFLNTFGGTVGNGDLQGFCMRCHVNRANGYQPNLAGVTPQVPQLGNQNLFGNHPTGVLIADSGYRGGPDSALKNPPTFPFASPLTAPPLIIDSFEIGKGDWKLGPHIDHDNRMSCATCHAVHGLELNDANPALSDTLGGVTRNGVNVPRLLADNYESTYTDPKVPATNLLPGDDFYSNQVCIDCHYNGQVQNYGGIPVDLVSSSGTPAITGCDMGSGPGALGTVSHPIGRPFNPCWKPKTIKFITKAVGTNPLWYPWYQKGGAAGDERLICTSCHDVHWAPQRNFCLARACNECHTHHMKNHHPSSYDPDWNNPTNPEYNYVIPAGRATGEGKAAYEVRVDLHLEATAQLPFKNFKLYSPSEVIPTPDGYCALVPGAVGNYNSGLMVCQTCHGGGMVPGAVSGTSAASASVAANDFCTGCHGTAHNYFKGKEAGADIAATNKKSEWCVFCHTMNPSQYTFAHGQGTRYTPATRTGTHYCSGDEIGNIPVTPLRPVNTINYGRHANPDPFYSGGVPNLGGPWYSYSGENGLPVEVYSKYGDGGDFICESCHTLDENNRYSINRNRGMDKGHNVRLLLAPAGEDAKILGFTPGAPPPAGLEDLPGQDMCVGCHGVTPGGGHTHPVEVIASRNITDALDPDAEGSLRSDGVINCESCHRAHDASGTAGAAIIKYDPVPGTPPPVLSSGGTGGTVIQPRRIDELCIEKVGHVDESYELCNQCHNQGYR